MSMEAIEKEINDKLIEKGHNITQEITELENATIVEKKPRSEAQKKSFEKARAKRMENLKNKKEAKEDKSVSFTEVEEIPPLDADGFVEEPAPPPPKKKRGRPKGARNKKVIKHQEPPPTPDRPYYPHPVEYPIPQAQPPQYQFQGAPQYPPYYPPPPQPQAPVNNYYYYGAAPQQVANEEPEYSVVDSEEDEVIDPSPPATTNPDFEYQEAPVEATLRYRFV